LQKKKIQKKHETCEACAPAVIPGRFTLYWLTCKQYMSSFKRSAKKKLGSFFDGVDELLDRTSRFWMYLLEAIGVIILIILFVKFYHAIEAIEFTTNEIELARARAVIDAIQIAAGSMKELIIGLCAAIPALIGFLRQQGKKWGSSSSGSRGQGMEE
jgi:hypothetical protein